MATSLQVAEMFRQLSGGTLTPLQLIKLTYIAHGWSLVRLDEPLVGDTVQAWTYGPVYPALYRAVSAYRGNPVADAIPTGSDCAPITEAQSELIRAVYENYGSLSGGQLSSMTHRDGTPWHKVWTERGQNSAIHNETIRDFYENIDKAEDHSAGA